MTAISTDVLISGGGIAGLITSCAFASEGFSVVCVDAQPQSNARSTDLRSSAFWKPAQQVLDTAGLWKQLHQLAAPLTTMRIIDAGGFAPEPREIVDFRAEDIADERFGWNIPNADLHDVLHKHIACHDRISLIKGVKTQSLVTRETEVRVGLSDGTQVHAKLLIGADGRNSRVRDLLAIPVKTYRYGQKALVFTVTHTQPHDNVSTEIHRSGGPFTLVPLPDLQGRAHSAVIWMETGQNILRLRDLPTADFNVEISQRSCRTLGNLELASQRTAWPIIGQIADRLIGKRTALAAEAAHVVPPIGAQGLNMSLADVDCLLRLASENPRDLGTDAMLDRYQQQRFGPMKSHVTGIHALNIAARAQSLVLRDLRLAGLKAIHGIKPLRTNLMRAGVGRSRANT